MGINILPTYDPGAQIGEGLGKGFGGALQMLGQQERSRNALDALKSLDPNGDPFDNYIAAKKATAGVPGLENVADQLLPMLRNRQRASMPLSGAPTTGQEGQQPVAGQEQVQGQQPAAGNQQAPAANEKPKYTTLQEYENGPRAASIRKAGGTQEDLINDWNLQNEDVKQSQSQEQLGLSRNAAATNVYDKNYESWAVSKGVNSKDKSTDQLYRDYGQKYFSDLEKKGSNPEANWRATKVKLDELRRPMQTLQAAAKVYTYGNASKVQALVTGVANAVKQVKEITGDTPEINEQLIADLTGPMGRDYAIASVQPPSATSKRWLANIPERLKTTSNLSSNNSSEAKKALEDNLQYFLPQNLAPGHQSPLRPTDNIELFRNEIFRKTGLPQADVDAYINKIADAGGLSPTQMADLPNLTANPPHRWLLLDLMGE